MFSCVYVPTDVCVCVAHVCVLLVWEPRAHRPHPRLALGWQDPALARPCGGRGLRRRAVTRHLLRRCSGVAGRASGCPATSALATERGRAGGREEAGSGRRSLARVGLRADSEYGRPAAAVTHGGGGGSAASAAAARGDPAPGTCPGRSGPHPASRPARSRLADPRCLLVACSRTPSPPSRVRTNHPAPEA